MEEQKHVQAKNSQSEDESNGNKIEVKQFLEKCPFETASSTCGSTLGDLVEPTDPLIVVIEESSSESSQTEKYSSQETRYLENTGDTSVESLPSKVVAIEPLEDVDEANDLLKGVQLGINRQILAKNPHIRNQTLYIPEEQVDIASAKIYIMEKLGDPIRPRVQFNELVTKGNLKKIKLEEEVQKKELGVDGIKSKECADGSSTGADDHLINASSEEVFKKPNLGFAMGPMRGKLAGKLRTLTKSEIKMQSTTSGSVEDKSTSLEIAPSCTKIDVANTARDSLPPLPYNEPPWSGYPSRVYGFEIVRGGQIIEQYDLSTRSSHSIGRSPACDISLRHLTISRFHVIMQYRDDDKGTPGNPPGFYVYDLGSTHGTFLNKSRIKTKVYVRVHVGHILKFGCSTRFFVLTGPTEDEEEESTLSVTQMQMQRSNELIRRKLEKLKGKEMEDDHGINWGMDDDADEETDLTVNPFASTNNEELYLDDPKKTLRGWFEREGHELVYDVEEKASGQFLCQIELPVESARGGIYVAEALVKGKKKEAVLQCALEACRVLDRYGLLRQATHESKKRKAKDWEADDFYDSDDDTFLDRTGAVEKKRKARMESLTAQTTLTYTDLKKQYDAVLADIQEAEARLQEASSRKEANATDKKEVHDDLDEYMSTLSKSTLDKTLISRLKWKLMELKREETRLRNLVNLVRPLDLPKMDRGRPGCSELPSANSVSNRMAAICRKAKGLVKSKKSVIGSASASTSGLSRGGSWKKKTNDEGSQDQVEFEDETQISDEETSYLIDPLNYKVKATEKHVGESFIRGLVTKAGREKLNQKDHMLSGETNYAKLTTKSEPLETNDSHDASKNAEDHERVYDLNQEVAVEHNEGKMLQVEGNLRTLLSNDESEKTKVFRETNTKKIPKKYVDSRIRERKTEDQTVDGEMNSKMPKLAAKGNKGVNAIQVPLQMQEILKQTPERKRTPSGSKDTIVDQARLKKKFEVKEGKTETEELEDEGTDEEDDNDVEGTKEEVKRKKKNRKRIMQRNVKSMRDRHARWAELDTPHELFTDWTPPEGQSGDGRTTLNDRLGY